MNEESKNLGRTLWVICVLTSPITGLALLMWITAVVEDGLWDSKTKLLGSAILGAFSFSTFHGVAAFFVRRGALWASQAAAVLAIIWIVVGLIVLILGLVSVSPVCLLGVVISMGGFAGLNMSGRVIEEIKADDGWNRDGPLRDSKGFQVVLLDVAASHSNALPGGEETKPHPTVSDRAK